ncbi:MAG: phage major capsid protein [Sulfurimonas sp.]|nr:phage major capsid protein [Sulfurimonas sp.]PHQ90112.1 MAG: phage major capsid protein [Sulfurimonas sp.]
MLKELIALRRTALAAMTDFNGAHVEMDNSQLKEFQALEAKFDKTNRDVKMEQTKNVLASEIDALIDSDSTSALSLATAEYTSAFDDYIANKNIPEAVATMVEGVDADGGFTVPQSYSETVISKLNTLGRTRSISSVMSTTSITNIPTEGDAPTFAWIDEGNAYGETKSTFGKVQLGAYKLGGTIKVSRELLADTAINFDSYMAGQIAKGIDKAESPAFAVGNGVKKPTGYMTTAAVGDSSTTAAVDSVTADEIIDIYHDLADAYRNNATWRMNSSTFKSVDKLKDGQGNYLLTTFSDGTMPTIKGRPVVIDDSIADFGTGNKFIVLGDFSFYQIADRGAMTIQRLDELYAGTGMIGFQVTVRLDAQVTIPEAFNAGKNA